MCASWLLWLLKFRLRLASNSNYGSLEAAACWPRVGVTAYRRSGRSVVLPHTCTWRYSTGTTGGCDYESIGCTIAMMFLWRSDHAPDHARRQELSGGNRPATKRSRFDPWVRRHSRSWYYVLDGVQAWSLPSFF